MSSYNSEDLTEDEEHKFKMSAKGKRMADSIAEYLLLRYFFGVRGMKDRRKVAIYKQAFQQDMQFNLSRGTVTKATLRFSNKKVVEEVLTFFEGGHGTRRNLLSMQDITSEQAQRRLVALLDELKFVQSLKNFEFEDKIELLKRFQLKRASPGQRIDTSGSHIDQFCLILRGKVGVFFPDPKMRLLQPHQIVCCNEEQAKSKEANLSRQKTHQAKILQAHESPERNRRQSKLIKLQVDIVHETLNEFAQYLRCSNNEVRQENPLYQVENPSIMQSRGMELMRERISNKPTPQLIQQSACSSFRKQETLKRNNRTQIRLKLDNFVKSPTQWSRPRKQMRYVEDPMTEDSVDSAQLCLEVLQEEAVTLTDKTCPLYRDTTNKFAPLERLFGTLNHGCAFGEFAVQSETKARFYSPIALTKCLYLAIEKENFERLVSALEKKALLDKLQFMRTIPEFNTVGLSRTRLQTLCQNLFPVSHIKGVWLFKEGDPVSHVYFIRSGELDVSMKVSLPQLLDENVIEIFKDPLSRPQTHPVESKQHVVASVGRCNLLGIEDAVLGRDLRHSCSVMATSAVELYKIDREAFYELLKPTQTWVELVKKASDNVHNYHKSLRNFKQTYLAILLNNRQTQPVIEQPKQQSLTQLISEIQTAGYSSVIHGAKAALLLASRKNQIAASTPVTPLQSPPQFSQRPVQSPQLQRRVKNTTQIRAQSQCLVLQRSFKLGMEQRRAVSTKKIVRLE